MKIRRTMTGWALVAAMILSMFSGLNAAFAEAGAKTYDMFIRSTDADRIKELKWYDAAEQNTGVHVNYIAGPEEFADVYSEVDQRILSGTLPDAVMTKLTQTNVYGPQGAFLDLAPLIAKYAPHLQAYIDANPAYKALVTDEKGAIYGLCRETPVLADFIGYRVDQFKKAGIDVDSIKTVDDFTGALRTLKAFYGKGNKNYYPLCGRDNPIRFAAWFGCAGNISSAESNGVYVSGHCKDGSFDVLSKNAYTMVSTMKTWYDEGLINPEWIAGASGEADWEATMLSGNGSVFYDDYNRAEWFMENGGPQNDPDYQMGVLNFLQGAKGKVLPVTASTRYSDEAVTAISAKVGEEKAATILGFIDYFYSDEGIALANYGVEGESFRTNADGTKDFIVDYATEESKPAGEKKWSFLSDRFTVCKPVDNTAFFKWNMPLISEAAERLLKPENLMTAYTLKFTSDQAKQLSNMAAAVYDAQVAGIISFINGSRDLTEAEWATFQGEMNDLGLSQIEDIQRDACRATYGK